MRALYFRIVSCASSSREHVADDGSISNCALAYAQVAITVSAERQRQWEASLPMTAGYGAAQHTTRSGRAGA
jgi:hypothetical protein